ncbi:MAG TPA: cytochrome c oxidase subunit I [Candidatus Limnocylindrales bacterium]
MSTLTDVRAVGLGHARSGLLDWLSTTDHKRIGLLYIGSAIAFFLFGGLLAELMRAQLTGPAQTLVSEGTYDSLFTMHGTIMLLLFGTPMAIGLANYLVPLQIGAADMAFPRLNALSFWLFLFGSLIVLSSFLTSGGAPAVGWFAYAPLTEPAYSPGPGLDLWAVGLIVSGVSSVVGAVNFIATIYARRAPGMTMFRMPIFTWNVLVTAALILFTFPALTAGLVMLFIDRHFGGAFFDPSHGGSAVLWQHVFWFFGHPEVYILILPFFGVITEIIPVFSRKPVFGYRAFVLATVAIASLSMAVWAHHMFATGAVNNPFFSIMSLLIAVPTGIKFFNWTATMWRGQLTFPAPMLWAMGFLYLFLVGGITGVMVASPPLDYHFEDSYFVVAHFHATLVGGTTFATFAGLYFWFPKMTGRRLDERLAKLHFWAWLIGFTLTFGPQFQLGLLGMPRRIAQYPANPEWQPLNVLSTIGALLLGLGVVPFLLAVWKALRSPADAGDDPWGGNSLEWATTSPPPHHDFFRLPPIRSERPVFDARMAAAGLRPEGGGPDEGSTT